MTYVFILNGRFVEYILTFHALANLWISMEIQKCVGVFPVINFKTLVGASNLLFSQVKLLLSF